MSPPARRAGTVPFVGRLLDYPVVVRTSEPEAQAAVQSILQGFAPGATSADAVTYVVRRDVRERWHVETEGTSVCEAVTLSDALLALEWRLVTDMLARSQPRFHLHGAALAVPSGSTSILLAGVSGTGKTTLTLGLMGRGFLPFSDDVVLIDPPRLEPVAFRRAFHVDATTRTLVERTGSRDACRFDGLPAGYAIPHRWAQHHAPVRAIFFLRLRRDEAPAVTRLPVADAATTVLGFSSTLDSAPALALAVAARLTQHAPSYTLDVGELEATVDLVTEVTERDAEGLATGSAGEPGGPPPGR